MATKQSSRCSILIYPSLIPVDKGFNLPETLQINPHPYLLVDNRMMCFGRRKKNGKRNHPRSKRKQHNRKEAEPQWNKRTKSTQGGTGAGEERRSPTESAFSQTTGSTTSARETKQG